MHFIMDVICTSLMLSILSCVYWLFIYILRPSLIAQLVKNLPAMQETLVRYLGWEDLLERIGYPLQYSWASLVPQLVKNLPAMLETWVRFLGWEDPLDQGTATRSSILTWRISWIV